LAPSLQDLTTAKGFGFVNSHAAIIQIHFTRKSMLYELEIFKVGKWTDKFGQEREWSIQDLDNIVAIYNSQTAHEAPIIIGHAEDNSPSFGWTKRIARKGDTLFAYVSDVSAQLIEWESKGVYRKKSIALGANGLLRHIAFVPVPAVTGLRDGFVPVGTMSFAQFNSDNGLNAIEYEFEPPTPNTKKSGSAKMDEKFIEELRGMFTQIMNALTGRQQPPTAAPQAQQAPQPPQAGAPFYSASNGNVVSFQIGQQHFNASLDAQGNVQNIVRTNAMPNATNDVATAHAATNDDPRILQLTQQLEQAQETAWRAEFSARLNETDVRTRIAPVMKDDYIEQLISLRKEDEKSKASGMQFSAEKPSKVDAYVAKLKQMPEVVSEKQFASNGDGTNTFDKTGEAYTKAASGIVNARKPRKANANGTT
jgi:hypothetical protein